MFHLVSVFSNFHRIIFFYLRVNGSGMFFAHLLRLVRDGVWVQVFSTSDCARNRKCLCVRLWNISIKLLQRQGIIAYEAVQKTKWQFLTRILLSLIVNGQNSDQFVFGIGDLGMQLGNLWGLMTKH